LLVVDAHFPFLRQWQGGGDGILGGRRGRQDLAGRASERNEHGHWRVMIVSTLCLFWYDDTTAFRYCKCGVAVGNRRRRASAIDESKSSANYNFRGVRERLFQKRLDELYEYRKLHGTWINTHALSA
jgi:hypothetical protein